MVNVPSRRATIFVWHRAPWGLARIVLAWGIASAAHADPRLGMPQIPVEVVTRNVVCARLMQTFANEAAAEGLDPVEQDLFTGVGAASLINALQTGELEAKVVRRAGAARTPANTAPEPALSYVRLDVLTTNAHIAPRTSEPLYAPLAAFLAPVVGAIGDVGVAMSPDELRFLPFAQKGMSMIVVARNAAGFDAERSRRVADIARTLAIRIYLVWAGPENPPAPLMDLVASTGGAAAVLGADAKACRQGL